MALFSYTQLVKANQVFIPENMRAYFGWHNDLTLHISSLRSGPLKQNLPNELIVSQVTPDGRFDLWRLQASFMDRRGLVSEITYLLKSLNINIISCKISTVDQNKYLNIELEVDNRRYTSEFDGTFELRKKRKYVYLDELKNTIVSEFIKDLIFISSDKPRPLVKVKRNLPLYRSVEYLDQQAHVTLKSGYIKIPNNFLGIIKDGFVKKYPGIKIDRRGFFLASVVADLESCMTRIFIFYPNTGYMHIRVKAAHEIGAIHAITQILHKNGININQMFTRSIGDGSDALTDFLIHHTEETNIKDSALQSLLRNIFQKAQDRKIYNFQIFFPNYKEYERA